MTDIIMIPIALMIAFAFIAGFGIVWISGYAAKKKKEGDKL